MLIKVKQLPPDKFDRPRLKNVETGRIYADINLGDPRYGPPAWYTTSKDGEPDSPLRPDIVFEIVGESSNAQAKG